MRVKPEPPPRGSDGTPVLSRTGRRHYPPGVVRPLAFTVIACAAWAPAGCAGTAGVRYDPGEQLLETTQRPPTASPTRAGAAIGETPAENYRWTLEGEYKCRVHVQKPSWRQPATEAVICAHCTDRRCLPEMVAMHRVEREATELTGTFQPVATASSAATDRR